MLYGDGNLGQTHYFLPVLVKNLDHLPIFSLACGQIYALGNPEETLTQTLQSAIRATANGMPAVLLLPDIEVLETTLPQAVWKMVSIFLQKNFELENVGDI